MVKLVGNTGLESGQYVGSQMLFQLVGSEGAEQYTECSDESADLEVNSMHVLAVG